MRFDDFGEYGLSILVNFLLDVTDNQVEQAERQRILLEILKLAEPWTYNSQSRHACHQLIICPARTRVKTSIPADRLLGMVITKDNSMPRSRTFSPGWLAIGDNGKSDHCQSCGGVELSLLKIRPH